MDQLSTNDSQPSAIRSLELLGYHFDLFIEHLACVTIDRHACLAVGRRGDRRRVHPVMLLPFHNEIVLKIGSISLVATAPGHDIDDPIPHATLRDHVH